MSIVERSLWTDAEGGTSVEYAVILSLIAGACVFVILSVGFSAGGMWGDSATDLGDKFGEIGVNGSK